MNIEYRKNERVGLQKNETFPTKFCLVFDVDIYGLF